MTTSAFPIPLDQPWPGLPAREALARFWKKGLTFSGRASRSEFWKAWGIVSGVVTGLSLASVIVSSAGLAIVMNTGNSSSFTAVTIVSALLLVCAGLVSFAAAVPMVAVSIRRLHDTGRSGTMYLVSLIPVVGSVLLLVLMAQPSARGESRSPVAPASSSVTPLTGSVQGGWSVPPASTTPPTDFFSGQVSTSAMSPQGSPSSPVDGGYERSEVSPSSSAGSPAPGFWTVDPGPSSAAPPAVTPVPSSVPGAAPAPIAFAGAPSPAAPITGLSGIGGVGSIPGRPVSPAPVATVGGSLDETRLSVPARTSGWRLELPDGRRIPVEGAVLIGRDPAGDGDVALVPVDDPARSMSKTHARFDLDAGAVTVTDLHSTNGTRLAESGRDAVTLAPGSASIVPTGSQVLLGDYAVQVRREGW